MGAPLSADSDAGTYFFCAPIFLTGFLVAYAVSRNGLRMFDLEDLGAAQQASLEAVFFIG